MKNEFLQDLITARLNTHDDVIYNCYSLLYDKLLKIKSNKNTVLDICGGSGEGIIHNMLSVMGYNIDILDKRCDVIVDDANYIYTDDCFRYVIEQEYDIILIEGAPAVFHCKPIDKIYKLHEYIRGNCITVIYEIPFINIENDTFIYNDSATQKISNILPDETDGYIYKLGKLLYKDIYASPKIVYNYLNDNNILSELYFLKEIAVNKYFGIYTSL